MAHKPIAIFHILCLFFFSILSECPAQNAPQLYNQAKFNQAIRSYRRAADAGSRDGYLNCAVMFKDLGHYPQAIGVLERASRLFPDDRRVRELLARVYYLDAQPQQAIDALEGAGAGGSGNDAQTLLMLGLCYDDLGRGSEAGEYLRQALQLDPHNIMARLSLADVYYRSKKLKESEQEYKAINLLDASIQHIYSYWGAILFELGNYREAFKIYEKMRAMNPADTAVLARLDVIRGKLGPSFFAKEHEKRALTVAHKKVRVTPAQISDTMVKVRVGLVNAASKVEFLVSSGFIVQGKKRGRVIATGTEGDICSVTVNADGKLAYRCAGTGAIALDEPVIVIPSDPAGTCTMFGVTVGADNFWHRQEDRSYRGRIEISLADGKVRVINVLSLEEYLYSVVPSEMLPKWPFEALKAQAVAARSEAMYKLNRHKAEGYDFCAEVHCQSYAGVERETAATNMAVDDTRGMVLQHKGKVVDAVYSSCCGGHTQDNIFGTSAAVAYFKGIPDTVSACDMAFPLSPADFESWLRDPPGDIACDIPEYAHSSNFRWVRVYSAAEMDDLARRSGDIGKVVKIQVLKRNPSGHIARLKLIGTMSSMLIEKELNIRKMFGNLRSSMFKVEIKYGQGRVPEKFFFYGGGWGHGVGMCQAGACGMAQKGRDFRQILTHYFAGVELKKIY